MFASHADHDLQSGILTSNNPITGVKWTDFTYAKQSTKLNAQNKSVVSLYIYTFSEIFPRG